MTTHVRAKFRCLKATRSFDKLHQFIFRPVWQKGKNSEENKRFWSSTPNGECTIFFSGEPPFEAGSYYYIDMVCAGQRVPGAWHVTEKTESAWSETSFGGTVTLQVHAPGNTKTNPGIRQGTIKLGLSNEAQDVFDMFGRPRDPVDWNVTFTFAEPSDEEES